MCPAQTRQPIAGSRRARLERGDFECAPMMLALASDQPMRKYRRQVVLHSRGLSWRPYRANVRARLKPQIDNER